MGSDPAITVEVTISDELRRLLSVLAGGTGQRSPEIVPEVVGQAVASDPVWTAAADWQEIRLRRDGQRPLTFRGLAVLTRSCLIRDPEGTAEQRLAIYLGQDGTLVASLIYEPPALASARPMHQCRPIEDSSDFELFLKGWHPEHSFETAFAADVHEQKNLAAGQIAARSAFNSLAAECLSKGLLHI